MPEYDGFFALEGIKSIDHVAKVIVLTGNTSPDIMEKVQRFDPHKILTKPFEADRIIDAVEGLRKPCHDRLAENVRQVA